MVDILNAEGVLYDLNGKTRNLPVSQSYLDQITAAMRETDPSLQLKIVSGGQSPLGSGGPRTGSTRHDIGADGYSDTADLVLVRNGKPVLPGDDQDLYARFLGNAAANGFNGIGHYRWGVHVGGGSRAEWGPDTHAASINPIFAKAIQDGWSRQGQAPATPKTAPVVPGSALSDFEALLAGGTAPASDNVPAISTPTAGAGSSLADFESLLNGQGTQQPSSDDSMAELAKLIGIQ